LAVRLLIGAPKYYKALFFQAVAEHRIWYASSFGRGFGEMETKRIMIPPGLVLVLRAERK
jgi:predicted N-acetyltransferase YhbS